MSTGSETTNVPKCPECGANTPVGNTRCWLCGADVGDVATIVDDNPYASPAEVRDEHPHGFSLASMMLFVTLFAVVVGVCSFAPGIGIPLALVVFIPFVRTAALVKVRAGRGRPTTWPERLLLGAKSALVVIAICTIVCVAAFATFFAACWVAFGASQILPDELVLPVFFGTVAIATLAVAVGCGFWARKRWQRDVGGS